MTKKWIERSQLNFFTHSLCVTIIVSHESAQSLRNLLMLLHCSSMEPPSSPSIGLSTRLRSLTDIADLRFGSQSMYISRSSKWMQPSVRSCWYKVAILSTASFTYKRQLLLWNIWVDVDCISKWSWIWVTNHRYTCCLYIDNMLFIGYSKPNMIERKAHQTVFLGYELWFDIPFTKKLPGIKGFQNDYCWMNYVSIAGLSLQAKKDVERSVWI